MKSFMGGRLFLSGSVLMVAIVFLAGCQQQPPDPSQTLRPIANKYVEVWNTGNFEELDSIFDQNFVRRANLLPDVNGVDGLKKMMSGFRTAYPDLKIVLTDEVYSDNEAAARWTFTGTNTGPGEMPPTGKSVKVWGISILHFANGKITEEIVAYDNQSFMEQLGYTMMPPKGGKK
jgi:steroid delta-isomerase-like uncharacterized protein